MWFLTWVSNYWIKCVTLTVINDRKGKGLNTGQARRSELPMMNTVNMTFKKKITNLKSLSLRWVRWSWMTLKLILKNHEVPCVIFLKKFVLKIFWKLQRALERNCGTESYIWNLKLFPKPEKLLWKHLCIILHHVALYWDLLKHWVTVYWLEKTLCFPVCRKPTWS